MRKHKWQALKPMRWSVFIFVLAQALTLLTAWRENPFLNQQNIYVPSQPPQAITIWPGPVTSSSGAVTQVAAVSSLGPILIYFFGVVFLLGIALFLIPVSVIRQLLKALLAFLFAWGTFIVLTLWLPFVAAIAIAAILGVLWFFLARIWLHDLALLLSLVALGAVFGRFISPWTAMIILLVLALYDFLAVRFGYMLWMVNKLSGSSALPAFITPRNAAEWNSSIRKPVVNDIAETKQEDRQFSVLGGGDIGFPALLVASVYFASGLSHAIIVSFCALIGLIGAYWIQFTFLKGKPTPALPPIAVASLVGLVLITLVL